jgi:hypothetical protein
MVKIWTQMPFFNQEYNCYYFQIAIFHKSYRWINMCIVTIGSYTKNQDQREFHCKMLDIYLKKNEHEGSYLKSGAWFFPKVQADCNTTKILKPFDIWEILRIKIEKSDVLVAILTTDSYGTITEASYAAGIGHVLYILFLHQLC